MVSTIRSTQPGSKPGCWRLRYPIDGYAAAGTPVLIGGQSPDDPDEISVIVNRRLFTLPPYYLNAPASPNWASPDWTPMTDQAVLSIPDAGRYLGGISRAQVYKLIDAGQLTRVKIGRRAMITRASCDQYLESLVNGVQ